MFERLRCLIFGHLPLRDYSLGYEELMTIGTVYHKYYDRNGKLVLYVRCCRLCHSLYWEYVD